MRRQLPVYSALSLAALLDGLAGALGKESTNALLVLLKSEMPVSDALLADSGTSALTLALSTPNSEAPLVALPAYACYDLATAADGANARVVLYDVDPHTLAPDPDSLARALAFNPRFVVIVHLFGIPVDISSVQQAAAKVGAIVIEDAAQAVGASAHGARAGSRGSLAIMSFGRGKGISGGGGGALLANDQTGAARIREIRALHPAPHAGWSELTRVVSQWLLGRPSLYGVIASLPFLHLGETIYHAPQPPRALSRASARIIANIWQRAHADSTVRRANAERLLAAAARAEHVSCVEVPNQSEPGFLRLPMVVKGASRDATLTTAATQLGIMPGYPLPLSRLEGFKQRCINADDRFPGAELLAQQLITLPTHSRLKSGDLQRLENWLLNSSRLNPSRISVAP